MIFVVNSSDQLVNSLVNLKLSRVVISVLRFALLSVCLGLGWSVHSVAQTEALESLLEEYPEQDQAVVAEIPTIGATRAVFSEYGRARIADVDAAIQFKVVRRDGRWLLVRFNVPTVPLWVSERYLKIQNSQATVQASNLNARLRPSINAPVIASVGQGHRTSILDRQNGFARITVGPEVVVAIQADGVASASNVTSSVSKNAVAAELAPRASKSEPVSTPEPEVQIIAAQTLPSKTIQERQHLIAPGDAISLLVFGEADLSVENVRVPESGRVSLPLIGSVAVAGQTTRQVEDAVRATLSEGYVKNPRLSVTIFSYRPIFIRGGVRSTGSFPYTEGLTIAKAIALAGGSKNSAKRNGVSVLRDGETIESGLALDSQRKVASGDVITIDEELGVSEEPNLYIYLHGEVSKPGAYLYRRGLTVEKAIVLAGGFSLRGSSRKIKVTRYAGKGEGEAPEKLKGVKLYTPVEPGDVLKIGARWF